ncbi:MAG: glycerate kinase [Comamonadaceae bacterium]|nr:glycerate kinase [Comamonadaceae bacterium]
MNFQRIAIPLLIIGLLVFAWYEYSWPGLAAVGGGLVMWLLLHWTRLITVMKRAADRPIGWVASAVMLNAKLKPGVNLLHVTAMTRSLGERLSAEGEEPERYRWTDNGGSSVTVTFQGGRVKAWDLQRPLAQDRALSEP